MSLHHILVRDFTTEQKKAVEDAADGASKSTSRYIRDAAVKAAGGKLDDQEKKPRRKTAKVTKPKAPAKVAPKPAARKGGLFGLLTPLAKKRGL